MSLLIVHTRWAGGSATHLQRLTTLLERGGALPEGCCSRQLRRHGDALFGTEIWADQRPVQTGQVLADVLDLAGLGRPTHTAMFSVPDPFATAYLRAGRYPGNVQGWLGTEHDSLPAVTAPDEPPPGIPEHVRTASTTLPRQRSNRTEPAITAG